MFSNNRKKENEVAARLLGRAPFTPGLRKIVSGEELARLALGHKLPGAPRTLDALVEDAEATGSPLVTGWGKTRGVAAAPDVSSSAITVDVSGAPGSPSSVSTQGEETLSSGGVVARPTPSADSSPVKKPGGR